MNDLSCGIRIWAQFSFVLFSQSTRFMTEHGPLQTDGRTDISLMAIPCSRTVKIRLIWGQNELIRLWSEKVKGQGKKHCSKLWKSCVQTPDNLSAAKAHRSIAVLLYIVICFII